MIDRTVHQAVKGGAKTVPVTDKPRPKTIRGNVALTPAELSLALEMARSDRLEQDIRDYACRKRVSA